ADADVVLEEAKEVAEDAKDGHSADIQGRTTESQAKIYKIDLDHANKDLEALWSLVKERFSTTKPKNFSDDFLLVTLRAMFEKPDIHAQIWKNQRSVHGPAKVKERKYPLTRFTLDQMLNTIRLEVEEESDVSLELL
nr:hypothetical protein [Tanacetum cinerariifolium]